MTPDARALLTTADAADYCSLSEKTIQREIRRGEIPVRRVGRAVRIKKADLDAWIESLPTGRAS